MPQVKIYFTPRPVIPTENPFNIKGVPDGYFLGCTSSSCFCVSVFEQIVEEFRAIAPKEEDVCVVNSILFISPELAAIVMDNPNIAPLRC